MFFLESQFIAPFLAGLFLFGLGGFTLSADSHSATHRYFFATTGIMGIWSLLIAIFHMPGATHVLWNAHWIAGFFIAPTYLLTLANFPIAKAQVAPLFRAIIWGGTALMVTIFIIWPQSFIQYYGIDPNSIPKVQVGSFSFLIELYFALYFLVGLSFLAKGFLKTYGRPRAQIGAGALGLIVGTGGGFIANVFLPIHMGIEVIWLAPIFAIIGATSFSYMLLGIYGMRTRLLPIAVFSGALILVFTVQMFAAQTVEELIFSGTIFAGTILLALFLIRDTLLESADFKRFQAIFKKLQQTNRELKRADQIKSEFLRIASHHIRTPLSQIKWALTELLAGNYGNLSSQKQKKLIGDLLVSNERLVRFVNALFDSSRIESGQLRLKKTKLDIAALIKEVREEFERAAKEYYRVKITVIPPSTPLPRIQADRALIRRVFENILENAIVYNRPGGKVSIKIAREGTNAKITVADTGIGISSLDLRRVGEKFFRPPDAKKHAAEGTGLGIFLARHILQVHGGSIRIQSKKDKGTTVFIALPLRSTKQKSGVR